MEQVNRDCLSVMADETGAISALVVSSDEDRETFLSEILHYQDFAADPQVIFSRDIWLSQMWKSKQGRHFMCEVLGQVHWQTAGGFEQLKLSTDQLYCIWGLDDDRVFAAGANGRCFGFDGRSWSDMSSGLSGDISALHGTSMQTLYAAGSRGFAALWREETWESLDLPVNHDFRAVCSDRDGTVYLAGLAGACLALRAGELTEITGTDADIYAIRSFQGRLYFGSAEHGIFVLDGNELVPFKPKARGYFMDAGQERLLTCGVTQMAVFDGKSWKARQFG